MLEKTKIFAFPLLVEQRWVQSEAGNARYFFFILFYVCSIYIFMNRIVVMTADSAAGDEKAGFSTQSVFILRGRVAAYDDQEEKIVRASFGSYLII